MKTFLGRNLDPMDDDKAEQTTTRAHPELAGRLDSCRTLSAGHDGSGRQRTERVRHSPGPVACDSSNDPSSSFKVGVAQRNITPGKPVPMWGYGARHDRLSGGVLDPLRAKALVIE